MRETCEELGRSVSPALSRGSPRARHPWARVGQITRPSPGLPRPSRGPSDGDGGDRAAGREEQADEQRLGRRPARALVDGHRDGDQGQSQTGRGHQGVQPRQRAAQAQQGRRGQEHGGHSGPQQDEDDHVRGCQSGLLPARLSRTERAGQVSVADSRVS